MSVEIAEFHYNDDEIVHSWGELLAAELPELERVIYGLYRGNVGQLVASTDVGKSTLALNLAVSATAGRDFCPLYNQSHSVQKVLYIDGEATKQELRNDLTKMTQGFGVQESDKVKRNLSLICDAELEYEPLDLTNPQHQKIIRNKALACQADLIIVDNITALMNIEDENDNAKVKMQVINPLKKLARDTNSAVLMIHHSGKYNEGVSPNKSYAGRGASAFGGLSRMVIILEKLKNEPNSVKLICTKGKGEEKVDILLKLNPESRWFSVMGESKEETISGKEARIAMIVTYVALFTEPVQRKDIVSAFDGQHDNPYIGDSTITDYLKVAVKQGKLTSPRFGYYSAVKNIEGELPLAE